MAKKVIVEVVVDSSQAERGLNRTSQAVRRFDHDLARSVRGAIAGSGAFRGLGRSVAFASAGFLGGFGLAAAVRGAADELTNSIKVTAQTNAALKSTGDVAGTSAKQIDVLAKSLMRKSGVDDEAIKSAENLLLTFTQVRNEVGRGNDIFDQATKTILDTSVALNQGLAETAIQVGKALNDPVRGLTALRRVGVSFTTDQIKLIKHLAETGHLMQAQKMILKELNTEFGGMAAAVGRAQPWNRLRETLKNLSAQILAGFLPAINQLVDRMQAWVDRASKSRAFHRQLNTVVKNTIDVITGAASILGTLAQKANDVAMALGGWKTALELAIGAWIGFKVAGMGAAIAVEVTNIAAAAGTAAAWKAALISTGWGAFAVAAGLAAAYVIGHWDKVKMFFTKMWLDLQSGFDQFLLAIIEGFAHIPLKQFDWARTLKEQLKQDIADIRGMYQALGIGPPAGARGPVGTHPPAATTTTTPTTTTPHTGTGAATAAAKNFTLPLRLQIEQAKAEASGSQAAMVKAARDIRAFLFSIIPKLKGQKLIDAYGMLAQANQTIWGAISENARKAKEAADKIKAAAEKQRKAINDSITHMLQVMQTMRQNFASALSNVRSQIGELFQGPFLNPTAAQTKQLLGVPTPTAGGFAADLRAQTAQYSSFLSALARLRKRGAPQQLISELRGQGVAALPQIQALAGAPKGQLQQFLGAFRARERLAIRTAAMTVHAQQVVLRTRDPIVVDLTVNMDGKVVAKQVTMHQQRAKKKTASQTRGNLAGG